MNLTNFVVNQLIDQVFRAQTPYAPATLYIGLIVANDGPWVSGQTWGAGSYMTVLTETGEYGLYYSSAGGTGTGSPSFPGVFGESITDGTVTWVEQTYVLQANGAAVDEVAFAGSYGRVAVTSSLANWAGTQGSGTITASTGTSNLTTNNNNITWPAPTANWTTNPGVVWAAAVFDAASGGNLVGWAPVTVPTAILNGASTPQVPNSYFTFSLN